MSLSPARLIMRVAILGSTGPSGILLVRRFFQEYPSGSAVLYVRNPSKLPEDLASNPAITVVEGQLTDSAAFTKIFTCGAPIDAVVSVLGPIIPPPPGTPIADGYANFIPIMASHNVKRLVALATHSVKDSNDHFSLFVWLIRLLVKLSYNAMFTDINATSRTVISECDKHGIDWTIGRVLFLTDNPTYKEIITGYVGDGKTTTSISRHAIAEWWIRQIESQEFVRKSPVVSI